MRYLIVAEYDGTEFSGFQSQTNGRAVQDVLQKAASELYKTDIKITGCSRTDAGVHARGHVSHMDVPFEIPEEKIPLALNALLPEDVAVKKAQRVGDDFSARFNNNGKRYIYRIFSSRTPSPLMGRYSHFCTYDLNLENMQKAARHFEGRHNFEAFCAAGGSQNTFERLIYKVNVTQKGQLFEIEVAGQAFLYNMVRIIAGTLMEVGTGKIAPDDIPKIIESRDRKMAGPTLPAKGLTLEEVYLL